MKKIKKVLTKFLTKTFVGRIVDKAVLGGAVQSTTARTVRTNEGEVDVKEIILEIIVTMIPLIILLGIALGWWTVEEGINLNDNITP